jgi:hypothetical protein
VSVDPQTMASRAYLIEERQALQAKIQQARRELSGELSAPRPNQRKVQQLDEALQTWMTREVALRRLIDRSA